MNRLGRNVAVLAIGLTGLLGACKKSDSGASGAMFIESCTLNCSSNGATGGQVSCGVINTFQNQEIGVLFSKPVDLLSVNNQSFNITDAANGTVPAGTYLIDPFNPRRVIFRPSLTFDASGNPVFGFKAGSSYRIVLSGTQQGDSAPFVESSGGSENGTRLDCTITTDQGISDPVAGPPRVDVFVNTIAGLAQPANGATGVLLDSRITMVFNDLMAIGTLVIPGTGQSPFITVKLDPDGNIANTSDQVLLGGSYTFHLDQFALQTTVVFTPSQPFPGAGANLASPRQIVVNFPLGIRDLLGNSLVNAGVVAFTPVQSSFPPVTIPAGGENFDDLSNCDVNRTGANWGEVTPGRLTPGLGGGSGRLGDLTVASGDVVTLHTSPTRGVGRVKFLPTGPLDGDHVNINGVEYIVFEDGFGFPGLIEFENDFPALTLKNIVNELNNNPDPRVSVATYSQEHADTLRIDYDTAGATGTNFTFEVFKIVGGQHVAASSVISMSGPVVPGGTAHMLDGSDAESFAAGNLLDNFDYSANPGTFPNPVVVPDGVFEFATLTVENGGTLRLTGNNPARLLVRGKAIISGLIDVSGQSLIDHPSDSPHGQLGGAGGPNAGAGGRGGDRPNNETSDLLSANLPFRPWDFGIVNPGTFFQGQPGQGIGQVGTVAAGPAGLQYPNSLPSARTTFGDMQTSAFPVCVSEQVGSPGGGGAYALNGGIGIPTAVTPVASQGASNTPPDTAGGDAANAALEPPGGPLSKRKLTPEKGYLRGGAGGGGGGANAAQVETNGAGFPNECIDPNAFMVRYRSHSAGGGGGGGGSVQVQAGRDLILVGGIDASGGDGGSGVTLPGPSDGGAIHAAPGGAGSGGAILMQARQLLLSTVPNRLSIAGGIGGINLTGSVGGFGGPGLVRAEAATAPLALDVAQITDPIDPLDPNSTNYLSVGAWVRSRFVPASFQGAQSCWMRPPGSFFSLQFPPDAAGTPGWDMDLVLNFGAGNVTVPYRAPNGILPGQQTYESFWGKLLDRDLQLGEIGAPLVVRFQGANLDAPMPDPCNVDLTGVNSPIAPGTLTPWVSHPSELNAFGLSPDMIRFAIIFDGSKLEFATIVGVTNLRITALPN